MQLKWPFSKQKNAGTQRVAVQFESGCLRFILADKGCVIAQQSVNCQSVSEIAELAKAFAQQHNLNDIPASVVVGLNSYQMLLVEAPPVEPSEMAAALKWKVKDLLAQSIDETVVDGFLLPDDAFRGRQKMAYTVATERRALQSLVDSLTEAGLLVDNVEIPEIVLLRLLAKTSAGSQAELVMVVGAAAGFMMAIADGAVYLTRKLEITSSMIEVLEADQGKSSVERLVLEMQRSRDYFESQMGKGVISRLLLVTNQQDAAGFADILKQQTGLSTQSFNIEQVFEKSQSDLLHAPEDILLAAALNAA